MNNKDLFEKAVTRFEKRDVIVQFGCWLTINYVFLMSINKYVLCHSVRTANYPKEDFAEDLFEFWLTL